MNTRLLENHTHRNRHFGPGVYAFQKALQNHHVPHCRSNIRIIHSAVYLEISKGTIQDFTKENALKFLIQSGKHRLDVAKCLLIQQFMKVNICGLQLYKTIS